MKVFVILYVNCCTNNYCTVMIISTYRCDYCEKFSPRLETRKTNGSDKFLEKRSNETRVLTFIID